MNTPLFWIIDEEWNNYDVEHEMLKQKYPECTIKVSGYDYLDDLAAFGKDCDAILAQVYTDIPASVIEQLHNCKAIAIYAGGFDRVDVVAAKAKGIKVTNVSGYCTEDLADYVMAAIYFFNKQLDYLTQQVQHIEWGAGGLKYPVCRISKSTVFILGFGRIGQRIAQKFNENHMNVIAYDPYMTKEAMLEHNVSKVEWEEGFMKADYVSINMILNEDTRGSITMKEFKLMKDRAYIINAARGQLINEQDLIEAVQNNIIAGAMLDVIANEPPHYDDPLFHQKNIYITPHCSYASIQSMEQLIIRTVNNAILGYEGGESTDWVNR